MARFAYEWEPDPEPGARRTRRDRAHERAEPGTDERETSGHGAGAQGASGHGAGAQGASGHRAGAQGATEAPPSAHQECYACPVGGLFAQAQRTSPDAMEHLLTAAAEFLKAARLAIDAAEAAVDQQRTARAEPRAGRVRRIDIS